MTRQTGWQGGWGRGTAQGALLATSFAIKCPSNCLAATRVATLLKSLPPLQGNLQKKETLKKGQRVVGVLSSFVSLVAQLMLVPLPPLLPLPALLLLLCSIMSLVCKKRSNCQRDSFRQRRQRSVLLGHRTMPQKLHRLTRQLEICGRVVGVGGVTTFA